jgi:hypothetical protein
MFFSAFFLAVFPAFFENLSADCRKADSLRRGTAISSEKCSKIFP